MISVLVKVYETWSTMPCQDLVLLRLEGEGNVKIASMSVLIGLKPVLEIVNATKLTSFRANCRG